MGNASESETEGKDKGKDKEKKCCSCSWFSCCRREGPPKGYAPVEKKEGEDKEGEDKDKKGGDKQKDEPKLTNAPIHELAPIQIAMMPMKKFLLELMPALLKRLPPPFAFADYAASLMVRNLSSSLDDFLRLPKVKRR